MISNHGNADLVIAERLSVLDFWPQFLGRSSDHIVRRQRPPDPL